MKKFVLSTLLLSLLASVSAIAGERVQFDVEALVIDTEANRLFSYEKTYEAEFQTAPEGVRDAFSDMLVLRADLPLKRPSTGEDLPRNFGLTVYKFTKPKENGQAYLLSVDFGPGQPLNESTRWADVELRNLDAYVGTKIHGETVTYEKQGGRTPRAYLILEISNFRLLK